MTTLTIEDEVRRLAREAAAPRTKSLDESTDEPATRSIYEAGSVRRTMRNGIPVMLVPEGQTAIDPDKVRRCLEEDGF